MFSKPVRWRLLRVVTMGSVHKIILASLLIGCGPMVSAVDQGAGGVGGGWSDGWKDASVPESGCSLDEHGNWNCVCCSEDGGMCSDAGHWPSCPDAAPQHTDGGITACTQIFCGTSGDCPAECGSCIHSDAGSLCSGFMGGP